MEAGDLGGLSIRTVAGPVAWLKVAAERVGRWADRGRAGQRPAGQHEQRWGTQRQGRQRPAGQHEQRWEPAVLELKPWFRLQS